MSRPKLVFVHGWGLNSAVWQPLLKALSGAFDCSCLDMPGYGSRADESSPGRLEQLADDLLQQVSEPAHWCGWSLGGMATMAAAGKDSRPFKSLNLLCTTPRFIRAPDWDMGMDIALFKKFADDLKTDYQTGIQKFLLLQAGTGAQARSLARETAVLSGRYAPPAAETLSLGLEILNRADLRQKLAHVDIPAQVISGRRDRVVHPRAGEELSKLLPRARYRLLNSGHAPHLSCLEELSSLITSYIQSLNRQPGSASGSKASTCAHR